MNRYVKTGRILDEAIGEGAFCRAHTTGDGVVWGRHRQPRGGASREQEATSRCFLTTSR